MEKFLVKGNYIEKSDINYQSFESNGLEFCKDVGLCGVNGTKHLPRSGDGAIIFSEKSQAIVVRFQFALDTTTIPRDTPSWRKFVVAFIDHAASLVDEDPSRFQLHVHPRDTTAELIVKANGNKPSTRSSAEIGVELAHVFQGDMETLGVEKNSLLKWIDTKYDVQIYTLQIDNGWKGEKVNIPPVNQTGKENSTSTFDSHIDLLSGIIPKEQNKKQI